MKYHFLKNNKNQTIGYIKYELVNNSYFDVKIGVAGFEYVTSICGDESDEEQMLKNCYLLISELKTKLCDF